MRTKPELRYIGLADQDRARPLEPGGEDVVRVRHDSASSGDPRVVRIPAVSTRSLTAKGTPCSHPRRGDRSAASASAITASRGRRETMALISGFIRSIRSSVADITSPAPISPASSAAERWLHQDR